MPNLDRHLIGTWFPISFLVVTLVPLGGARSPLAQNLFILLIAVSFLWAVSRSAVRDGVSTTASTLAGPVAPFAIICLPAVAVLQALAHSTVGLSNAPALLIWYSVGFLASLAAFFCLVRSAVRDRRGFRILFAGLLVIGALEATYGVLNLLSGNEYVLFYKRWTFFNSATGTFYSRNQFAYLMELTLPVAFACVTFLADRSPGTSEDSDRGARQLLIWACVIMMALGLVFSQSRMGMMSLVAATLVVGVANHFRRPRQRADEGQPTSYKLLATIALVVLAYAAIIGVEPVLERFLRIEHDLEEARLPLWEATVAMIKEKPIFGHGFGSVEVLLTGYRPRPTGLFFDHSHNDYLELFAEAGIIGVAAVAYLMALFVRRLHVTLAMRLSHVQRTVILALAVGIVSVLIHSIADFGLRIPGIAFTFVAVLALFSTATDDPRVCDSSFDPRQAQRRTRSHGSRNRLST